MTTDLTSSFLPTRRGGARLLVLLGLAGLASLPSSRAAAPGLDGVDPGDTFDVEAVGYNQADVSGDTYLIYPIVDATFGADTTFTNRGVGGQSVTVSSVQSVSGNTTTDYFFVSVPTNFVPAGTVDNNGNVIDAIDFGIGIELGGSDAVNFDAAVIPGTVTGSATFLEGGMVTSIPIDQSPTFSDGNTAFSDEPGITSSAPGQAISSYDVTGFSVTVSYISVPEPSTVATMLLGGAGLVWLALRRRQVGA